MDGHSPEHTPQPLATSPEAGQIRGGQPWLRQQQRGATLVELLVVMLIVVLIAQQASAFASQLLTEQRLTSRSNALVGLLYRARMHGIEQGGVWVCATDHCDQFGKSPQILIIGNHSGSPAASPTGPIIEQWRLPGGMTVEWRSFQNRPWLYYRANATSHFQNGHFLLCYKGRSRKVIITRIGRPRVDTTHSDASRCHHF